MIRNFRKEQRGAALPEYALLVALLAIIAIPAIQTMSLYTKSAISDVTYNGIAWDGGSEGAESKPE